MPPLPVYQDNGPLDCTGGVDTNSLKVKSVIVTGGGNGLGEAYVRAFASAGAYVTIGDLDEDNSKRIISDFPSNVQFVKCNVTSWDDQLAMFKAAISNSPSRGCDIVIANAGISGPDPVYILEDKEEPTKPNLRILDVNLNGVVYTTKLALHYFSRLPDERSRDRCLILQGSIAGFVDQPGSPQYNAAKYGLRGMMRSLRRVSAQNGVRVNYIAPWYIRTKIMSIQVQDHIDSKGVDFALAEDAAAAALRIACDQTINGRSLGIVPRKEAPNGYMDLYHDDYAESDFLHRWQETVLMASHRTAVDPSKQ